VYSAQVTSLDSKAFGLHHKKQNSPNSQHTTTILLQETQ